MYGSRQSLNMTRRAGSRGDLDGGGAYRYARSEVLQGDDHDSYMDGYRVATLPNRMSKGGGMAGGIVHVGGGMAAGMGGSTMSGMSVSQLSAVNQKAAVLREQCIENLKQAEFIIQSGGSSADADHYMGRAREAIERLKSCAADLNHMGQSCESVLRSVDICMSQLKGIHMTLPGTMQRRRSTRKSSGGMEEFGPSRSFTDAMGWIAQQKRLIETASFGDDSTAIEKNIYEHQMFHSSIQMGAEMIRARDELARRGDKANSNVLEREWDALMTMSFGRTKQLHDLLDIIQEISNEIMWVNEKEEEELMFDWGDKNIGQYIPIKQESYSKLMSILEDKERQLYKLHSKADALLKNNHPASDKIEAYKDTLQTQWSWLLQITKCIDVHLKENEAYSQFFKEAHDTYGALQKEKEMIQKTFQCDKNTSLEDLQELLKGIERENNRIVDYRQQVQHLVNRSRNIVRLKPRNPEEKKSDVVVRALCDYKQDQKVIYKGNEAILKDNSQRSKWQVIGPGGLDMSIPSVCLIVPPPNPLSIHIAKKNEQFYEAIVSIWTQLCINVKSLIAWQYCLLDIKYINSLTISILSKMRPEEYRQIIKRMETRYEEFKETSKGSEMFVEEDKQSLESQFSGAQAHYDNLVVQLPTYIATQQQIEIQQPEPQQMAQLYIIQQPHVIMGQETSMLEVGQQQVEIKQQEQETEVKKEVVKKETVKRKNLSATKTESVKRKELSTSSSSSTSVSSRTLSELHALRLKMEAAESTLSQHIHICIGDEGSQDCSLKISQLETVQYDINSLRNEYLRLKERITKELEDMKDLDKAQFLRNEIGVINQRLNSLEGSSSAYIQRLRALRDMLESVARAEDLVKVHEARLTERETTSLSPSEVEEYMVALKIIKAELDQKRDVLAYMETELSKAAHWNNQVGTSSHRCDMMLSKYTEQVGLLSDRWRRLHGQIDTRLQDLQLYLPQLHHYKQTSTTLFEWINATRKTQEALQATKIDSVQTLKDHINNLKALNYEIKTKKETVDSVLKDNIACVNAIKDYETDLASYSSGLETLLNIPIKRTMLRSPSMELNQEATLLQTRYMELMTMSGNYLKFLGELLKNMEDLKMRNTQIDLLEEELRLLKENMEDCNAKNKSLEDEVAQYQLELSQSQTQLLSLEEVKQTTALECSATKDSLDSTQTQLADLRDQVTRLEYLLKEERRKTKLAEERYTQQQDEYESVLRKRQNELETVSWSKVEVEKSVSNKDHEIEQLRRQLAEEAARIKELQMEISKIRTTMQSIQSQYNDILNERDALLLKLQRLEKDKEDMKRVEEDLSRIKLSLDSEIRNKQCLQDESERMKRDLSYWKDQCDGKQGLIRQYDTDKELLEREKNSLKSEIERLMRELRQLEETYKSKLSALQKELQETTIIRQTMETELKKSREPPTLDPSSVVFDGVRKPVTADQLLDCGVLDKPTLSQLVKGHSTVSDVSKVKKVSLKGTGPIAGVVIEGPGSSTGPLHKLTFTEAKKANLVPPDSVDLLLDAQAATGHIIDPRTNQKLTVEEAYNQGVIDDEDKERLLAAEAAAVGYSGPGTNKPLSVFQAMKKGLIDKNTTLRLLQAQESVGGVLDPILSVFLPRSTAIERNLIDDKMCEVLNQKPELYLDPENEEGTTYMSMKRRCRIEPHTGLLLLPVPEKVDASKLVFEGVRKPVTAKQLLDCGVLDKPTFKDLEKGNKTLPEVSVDKNINLKGTGPIAGVVVGKAGKMSLSEAKKKMLIPAESADLLLEAQAATGHIIDPKANKKLTVDEACAKGLVDMNDRDRLLEAEAAAIGYKDPNIAKPISVFQAIKKGLIDNSSGLRLLQAQESAGGILDPNLSVFLPEDTAIQRNLLDKDLCYALSQNPECYLDPETEQETSYKALKKRCKIEPHTGLLLLPITEKLDPSKLMFDGVRKPVSAQHLLDCGVLDKPTFNQLLKGEKTVPEVSEDKKIPLKGTGSIAGVAVGPLGKLSLTEAKKQMLIPSESADLLLEAQAATGHIIDPKSNQKLTVEEACLKGVVDKSDRDKLLAAEAAAVGYRDPLTAHPLSVFEAIKKGLIDKKTGLRLLQAQECAGGILDPNLSVFLPRDTAIQRNLLDADLCRALNQKPECYIDPETEQGASYGDLKKRCKTEFQTSLMLLPVPERKDPSKLMFEGVRKPVSAQQLLDCGVLDKPTFNQLLKGEKTVPEVSEDKRIPLKGTGSIAGVAVGRLGKMSLTEAKKQMLIPSESADLLLEAQAATGHIIEPKSNQKLTVEEACLKGVVDKSDRDKLLAAEAAAVGYRDPLTVHPISVFEAIKKGLIDKKTGLRLLQAQECAGGILDPNLSVFLPIDTAIQRNLLDADLCRALKQKPECYVDPETEQGASYGALKKRSKTEFQTSLMLLPVPERKDPSKLMFEGVRKPVSAQQLLDCGVLDKPTFNQLLKGEKTVPEVSEDKKIFLKGSGPIAGVVAGRQSELSFSEAKMQQIMSEKSADLLLEAQAATGHIIDPRTGLKLTVEEACVKGVVDVKDRNRLLAAEGAAIGFKDPCDSKPISVFEAMTRKLIDEKTGLRLLQAQESVGGILDPNLSVFLPKDKAFKRNLLDETLLNTLTRCPACYIDPETEHDVSYGALKKRCKINTHTGIHILPVSEKFDPSKLIFEGVRKTVTAQQLLDCGILDKPTFNQLMKGEKTVSEVSVDKKVFLKGTGSIAGVVAGPLGKMSVTEAKKQKIMPSSCADMLLRAQAATGHIIDPKTNQKLTVKEACARGVVEKEDESMLLAAEGAAIGYKDMNTGKLLSVCQAMRKGLLDKDTALHLIQAQESAGGVLDPSLSVFLPRDRAKDRDLIDDHIYQALTKNPECYLDPDTQQPTTYISLKKKCKVDLSTGLLLLPKPKTPVTVQGLRKPVSVIDLVDANLLEPSNIDQLNEGKLTSQDVEDRLHSYLRRSTCIAGLYDEASDKVLTVHQAMKNGLLRYGTALELLEAQAASGFIVDPINNLYLTVNEAYDRQMFGAEYKDKLLAAERAVTGYIMPGTDKILSIFQAMDKGLVEKGHGIRLLEAQIASGGIIDPEHSHRIDVNVAYNRGYFDEGMNKILTDESDDTKGFFDPNTEENLTYLELKKRCILDKKTGLFLLPIIEKKKQESTSKNTLRKRRVIIVDPETDKEMTIREAYDKGYIDYETFQELSEQESEWEEITITAPDGSTKFVIIDRKTGRQYDISELLEKRVIDVSVFQQYRSRSISLHQFAEIIADKTKHQSSSVSTSMSSASSETSSANPSSASTSRTSGSFGESSSTSSTSRNSETLSASSLTSSSSSSASTLVSRPLSPTFTKTTTTKITTVTKENTIPSSITEESPDSLKHISSVSVTLSSPVETVGELEPVGAIFDSETLEKISITEALNRGLVDSITAQRLLEAQACTGGIVNPTNGQRISIQEAFRIGIITPDMSNKLKPAQKAYIGFEDVKARRKMSVAEAMKEMWLPYEAGQRFMEFQVVTGGLYDPEMRCRRSIQDGLKMGWLDGSTAQRLQDIKHHAKNLTCPKSKLRISYLEALENCLSEEGTGVKMLQASSMSSRGISSPYNVASAPGSTTGSRSGSQRCSRRGSLDLGSSYTKQNFLSFTSFSSAK
ncbi:desmoplakin-B isoform 2-T2 [Menidia menidia]